MLRTTTTEGLSEADRAGGETHLLVASGHCETQTEEDRDAIADLPLSGACAEAILTQQLCAVVAVCRWSA